jgi:hypothetical protein
MVIVALIDKNMIRPLNKIFGGHSCRIVPSFHVFVRHYVIGQITDIFFKEER